MVRISGKDGGHAGQDAGGQNGQDNDQEDQALYCASSSMRRLVSIWLQSSLSSLYCSRLIMIIKIMKIIKIIYQNEHCVLAQIDEDVNPAGTRNQIAKKTDWSSYKDTKEKGKQNNLLLWCPPVS